MTTENRKEQILAGAIKAAEAFGYNRMTRDEVARMSDCSPGLVSNYFNTMNQLRRQVMRAAIKRGNVTIIGQGLALNDPHAKKAPKELKAAVFASLVV